MSTIVVLSLFTLISMMSAIAIIGRGICQLLPYQMRPVGRFFFSPLLGLALFIIIATLHGWFFPFHQIGCLIELLAALSLAIIIIPEKKKLIPYLIFLLPFALLASLNVFFPIYRFNAFNSFNDAFTYLVHSQWLQQHAFSEPAVHSGFFPALSQVTLYQGAAHRMGSSFFFGWVQAIFGIKWSYYIYPAVVSLPLISGTLAVGGAIKLMTKRNRIIPILVACLLPALYCGFTFGAAYGFFPQTFGLAFAIGGVTLFGNLVTSACKERNLKKLLLHSIPASLVLGAFAFCYNDLLSAIGAGIILFVLLYGLFNLNNLKYALSVFAIIVTQTALIINIEFVRILKNFLHVVLKVAAGSFVIGWPVTWHPFEFLANAFGFRTAVGEMWFANHAILAIPLFIATISIVIFFIFKNIKRVSQPYLLINLSVLAILLSSFILFRYFKEPVFPGETGITFLQYKATKWASPFCFVLMGAALCFFSQRHKLFEYIIPVSLGIIILIGNFQGYFISECLTNHFLSETGSKTRGFEKLLTLRKYVSKLDKDEIIYLNLKDIHHKLRQMVAYVLLDHKLASDYTDDSYFVGHLPANERIIPFEKAKWILGFNRNRTSQDHFGNLEFKPKAKNEVILQSVSEAYPLETNGNSWWHWAQKTIKLNYHILGDMSEKLQGKIKFTYMPVTGNQQMKLLINKQEYFFNMNEGWNEFISPPFDIDQSDFIIEITSLEPPNQLSKHDQRIASFLLGNAQLKLTDETVSPQSL